MKRKIIYLRVYQRSINSLGLLFVPKLQMIIIIFIRIRLGRLIKLFRSIEILMQPREFKQHKDQKMMIGLFSMFNKI